MALKELASLEALEVTIRREEEAATLVRELPQITILNGIELNAELFVQEKEATFEGTANN